MFAEMLAVRPYPLDLTLWGPGLVEAIAPLLRLVGLRIRPLDQVFEAAKEVVKFNGTLVNESILHNETNIVKTVEGKVNQRSVWVRVEATEPKVTTVVVQTRTVNGGSDIDLAHEIEKQIAIKLTR